jgi:taurine dioxygenase
METERTLSERAGAGSAPEAKPLTGTIGAEIVDIDLAEDLDDGALDLIRRALDVHGVLFFRDQRLSTAEFAAFASRLGVLEQHDSLPTTAGQPEVALLIKEADHVTSIGDMWHTDHTYLSVPMRWTMLRAIEVPEFGGDTLFLSTVHAFAALPDGMKAMLRSLKAVHSRSFLIKDRKYGEQFLRERPSTRAAEPAIAVHPVVRPHPATGAETLFVNPGYTVKFEGWTREQSAPLLRMLYDHCLQPEFQCRFRWAPGSIALWDNGQTWHYAVNDYQGRRRAMQRIVIA